MKTFIGFIADQNGFAKFSVLKAINRKDAGAQLFEMSPLSAGLIRPFEITPDQSRQLIEDLRKALPNLE